MKKEIKTTIHDCTFVAISSSSLYIPARNDYHVDIDSLSIQRRRSKFGTFLNRCLSVFRSSISIRRVVDLSFLAGYDDSHGVLPLGWAGPSHWQRGEGQGGEDVQHADGHERDGHEAAGHEAGGHEAGARHRSIPSAASESRGPGWGSSEGGFLSTGGATCGRTRCSPYRPPLRPARRLWARLRRRPGALWTATPTAWRLLPAGCWRRAPRCKRGGRAECRAPPVPHLGKLVPTSQPPLSN